MKIAFFVNLIIVAIICLLITKINGKYAEISMYSSVYIFFYSMISAKFLEKYLITKLISEGIKQNVNLTSLDPKSFYAEAREIFLKKLVH